MIPVVRFMHNCQRLKFQKSNIIYPFQFSILSSDFANQRYRVHMYSILHKSLKYSSTFKYQEVKFPKSAENFNLSSTRNRWNSSEISCDVFHSDFFGNLAKPLEFNTETHKFKKSKHIKNELKSEFGTENRKSEYIANVFGTLSEDNHTYMNNESKSEEEDPFDDSTQDEPVDERKSAAVYLKEMKFLVKNKKLKEALELFMHMKRNRVKPLPANYTFMIGACGRAGYTEMAFKLFRQMLERRFSPTPATLTGLFNACAESPTSEYGLKKAIYLKEKLEIKGWHPELITYNAMIKAFAKCGDIKTAFQIADEMKEAGHPITNETYNFLLMACVSDKEAGFTHAIQVWRKMIFHKQLPNIYVFNLLLRTVRDCNIGPKEVSCLLLQHWSSYTTRPYGLIGKDTSRDDILMLPVSENLAITDDSKLQTMCSIEYNNCSISNSCNKLPKNISEMTDAQPQILFPKENINKQVSYINDMKKETVLNLLSPRPTTGRYSLDFENISKPEDRLALVGGAEGFLELMGNFKVNPSIKTFSLLLESLPSNVDSEETLICLMKKHNIKPDTDFFNLLIKRRSIRRDVAGAKNVLLLIDEHSLYPDIVTFGVLALSCYSHKLGSELLKDMKEAGFQPNVEIIGALVSSARRSMDFWYLIDLMNAMKDQNIQPDLKILNGIEKANDYARKNIVAKESGEKVPNVFYSEKFQKSYKIFSMYYKQWLQKMNVDVPQKPWLQYKTEITQKHNN